MFINTYLFSSNFLLIPERAVSWTTQQKCALPHMHSTGQY